MKKSYILNILVIIVVLVGIFLYDFLEHKELETTHRYTLGTVQGHKSLSRGGIAIEYSFKYQEATYTGEKPTSLSKTQIEKLIDKRFFVRFKPDKPKLNSIDLTVLISDSVLKVPPEGWGEKPDIK